MPLQYPYFQQSDAYIEPFTELYTPSEAYEQLSLSMTEQELDNMLVKSLEADRDYWNQAPWGLEQADLRYTAFLLGDQLDDREKVRTDIKYVDNRIFSSVRAILSYATAQLAKPDIIPSKGDEVVVKGAREIGQALYQHSMDEKADMKVRAAVMNLITRKRGFLKLRWDPTIGENGDIVTEICNPEDIIIDRFAGYLQNPKKIYHRIRCTVEELCARFPEKDTLIKEAFSIRRGVYTQMSQVVTYFECWFTYMEDGLPKEGVAWFIPEKHLILDKMKNPNWVYKKNYKSEKEANLTSCPPKPFVTFNYFNTGHSYIDETCLVEQAIPEQIMLNNRLRQIGDNADYVNGRWVADKNAFNQEDARNLVNKGPRTVAMADMKDNPNPLINVAPNQLGSWVENTLYDARNSIDDKMGTPSIFKGEQPDRTDTLGRDLMIKQQAGNLQDDIVRAVNNGMEVYYLYKLQMMRVYYTDDYWFQTRGRDGKYEFILVNGDKIDSNVKVSVQIDSTLPLDKAMIRSTAMDLWNAGNAIDYRTLMEDLGLPDPDIRTERYLTSNMDPQRFLRSIQLSQINTEAEADIQLILMNKVPEERDDYNEDYFNYFNKFLTSNRFQKLIGEDQKAAERVVMFLAAIQHTVNQGLMMGEALDDAGIVSTPPPAPVQDQLQPQQPPVPPVAPQPVPSQ